MPDVPDVEVYSGVVSIETIRTAFVIAARNNLQVCAADISTAFLYGKTREKVYIIAGEEFGDNALKFRLHFYISDSFNVPLIKSDLRYKIHKSFNDNNIKIPFPQRDIHIINN